MFYVVRAIVWISKMYLSSILFFFFSSAFAINSPSSLKHNAYVSYQTSQNELLLLFTPIMVFCCFFDSIMATCCTVVVGGTSLRKIKTRESIGLSYGTCSMLPCTKSIISMKICFWHHQILHIKMAVSELYIAKPSNPDLLRLIHCMT